MFFAKRANSPPAPKAVARAKRAAKGPPSGAAVRSLRPGVAPLPLQRSGQVVLPALVKTVDVALQTKPEGWRLKVSKPFDRGNEKKYGSKV